MNFEVVLFRVGMNWQRFFDLTEGKGRLTKRVELRIGVAKGIDGMARGINGLNICLQRADEISVMDTHVSRVSAFYPSNLTGWTKVGAALGQDDPLDRRPADGAGLAGALEDAMPVLETAGLAAGPLIVLE